jgi:hypothetical protein
MPNVKAQSSKEIQISNIKIPRVVRPTLLYIRSEAVIPAKAGIQLRDTGFLRIKYGAGLVESQ